MAYSEKTNQTFHHYFGHPEELSLFSPGRVNLLGEHIDYNGGTVLPCALDLGLTLSMSARKDNLLNLNAPQMGPSLTRSLDSGLEGHWSDYVLASLQFFKEAQPNFSGLDLLITSTLPAGAGLSSSAALIVGLLRGLGKLVGKEQALFDIAKDAQTIENERLGVPCGVMDQMAVAIAKPGEILQLDCYSLQYRTLTPPLI